jgi:pimeloyl-ACP methyl ester carboxylesterase
MAIGTADIPPRKVGFEDVTGLPDDLAAPLKRFGGAEPPAPAWFRDAIAQVPERTMVSSLGTQIELLTWGEIGKPGLLLLHGNSAHADWWSFIAPFLAKDYRVAAMSLPGMGGSGWRDSYSSEDTAHDAEACARAAGLYADGRAPIYVGHSFGGVHVVHAAARYPQQMRAAILVDTGFNVAPSMVAAAKPAKPMRVYPTLAEALARFRLSPVQPTEKLYIVDYIARRSLMPAPLADGSGDGWVWRFDPGMLIKLDTSANLPPDLSAVEIATPLVHLYGELSLIGRPGGRQGRTPPKNVAQIEIAQAHHHVMIDQPLALVSALRTALALWPA